MVKARMTTADVAAEIACLRRLIGMRVANVYDLTPKTYVLKLARSGGVTGSGESEKELLLLESGVRLHSTQFARDKSNTPSGITLKIRKHIRTRRLEDIRQLGVDRVIDFQFGLGEQAHHLILELYASGNILLTDADYNVLTLLRSHRDDEKGISMMAKHRYPIESCRPLMRTNTEQISAALQGTLSPAKPEGVQQNEEGGEVGEAEASKTAKPKQGRGEGKDLKEGSPSLKELVGQVLGYGPTLCEHCILDAGLEPSARVQQPGSQLSEGQLQDLVASIRRFEDWLDSVREKPPEGFIILQKPRSAGSIVAPKEKKRKKGKRGAAESEALPSSPNQDPSATTSDTAQPPEAVEKSDAADVVKEEGPQKLFDEFTPLLLKQHEGRETVKFETFDAAMDEFFSKVEGQKLEQQQKQQEMAAMSRLDKIRADQTSRVEALEATVQQSVRKAELIEYNLEEVDAAIMAVRSALANGMDWADLWQMVKEERKAGNPVAGLIHSMQLEKNQISLLLSNNLDDMMEEEKTRPVDKVEVDISLSAFANARMHFDRKKKNAIKQQKTVDATERALKAAEKKTVEQLAQVRSMAKLTSLRKVHWFEKFNWFVSSENYLVLAGRDAQQNEQLVKKHLDKGDVYVHADLHGAASCVVKNPNPEAPIPPLTLIQAGTMTVCRSSAWDAKIVTSAWWVHSHQVSKTAPTGEYLTVGSFMVRGKKNFLPPSPLVMGFGFLFRLEESCLAAHIGERRIRGEGDVENGAEEQEVPRGRRVLNEGEAPRQEVEGTSESEEVTEETNNAEDAEGAPVDVDKGEPLDAKKEDHPSHSGSHQVPADESGEVHSSLSEDDRAQAGESGQSREASALDDLLDRELGIGQRRTHDEAASSQVTSADVTDESAAKVPKSGKRYVTKAERRKIKKGQSVGDAKTGSSDHVDVEKDEGARDLETRSSTENGSRADTAEGNGGSSIERSSKGNGNVATEELPRGKQEAEGLTRGKRAKLRKAKERYADQDDEERELRMAVLASAGKKAKQGSKSAGKEEGGQEEKPSKGSVENELKVCYHCKQVGHVSRDCPVKERKETPDGSIVSNEGSSIDAIDGENGGTAETQDQKESERGIEEGTAKSEGSDSSKLSRRARARAQNEGEKAEIAAILEEENLQELPDEEKDRLTELDALTGVPRAEDILLYGVPMCGPYTALQGFKYKVKLTPGMLKKGKAAKTAVEVFSRMPEAAKREKELMKAVQDPDLVAVMLGNVKVTAPGLTKMKQTQKKGRKAAAQK